MNQEEWENKIKKYMIDSGWNFEKDTETNLCFGFKENENHWMRDYDKKTHRFIQFNGNQIVNLVNNNEEI